jgi:lysophospholipase L1-like esterase
VHLAPPPDAADPARITHPTRHMTLPETSSAVTEQNHRTPALPRWKRVLFTLITIVFVYGVLNVTANVYLRVTRGYDGKHLYEFDFDPYKNITPARNFVDTRGIRHNSQGFRRDSDVSLAKPPGTYRIFLMGGSTAYGTGGLWPHVQKDFAVIPNGKTIDAYLEKQLKDSLPGVHVEVINAAITSTWTHHHLIYLNQTILKFHPDMVLFLDGFNDEYFFDPHHDQFGDFLYTTQASEIMGQPTLGALGHAIGWWAYRKSALAFVTARAARELSTMLASRPPRTPMNVDAAIAGLEETLPQNALKMHRRSGLILRDEGIVPVFMLQPMLILERGHKPMPPMEQKLFDFNVSSTKPGYEEFSRRAAKYIASQEQTMANQIGAEFIDLTPIYAGVPEQIYTDYVHLTPSGNERLARYVGDRLLPIIRREVVKQSATLATHTPVVSASHSN